MNNLSWMILVIILVAVAVGGYFFVESQEDMPVAKDLDLTEKVGEDKMMSDEDKMSDEDEMMSDEDKMSDEDEMMSDEDKMMSDEDEMS